MDFSNHNNYSKGQMMYAYVVFGAYCLILNLSGYFFKFQMNMARLTKEKCSCQNAKAAKEINIHIPRCVIKSQIIFALSASLKHIKDFIKTVSLSRYFKQLNLYLTKKRLSLNRVKNLD
jgi:hypothetical protein